MHIPAVVVGFSAILSLLINFPLLLFLVMRLTEPTRQ